MTSPAIPLPSDEQLTDKERKLLMGIPDANIFRAMANTSASLKPFLELAASILFQSTFDRRLRELSILRVATITHSRYEWAQHVRIGKIVGLTDDEIADVGVPGEVTGFDEQTLFVLRAAEEITRDVRLSDESLAELLERYGTQQATEFILCVSYFNMVSRFLESTRVPLEDAAIL